MFSFRIDIYSTAGELVRSLVPLTSTWGAKGGFQVQTTAFAPANGGKALLVAYGITYSWDGNNNNGQMVSNGIYNVVFRITDADGNVTTQAVAIAVISAPSQFALRIYNSAGELVRQIDVLRPTGSAAPSQLVAKPNPVLVTGSGASLSFNLGSTSLAWNGTSEDSSQLSSGVYTVELVRLEGSGGQVLKTTAVTLLRGQPRTALGRVYAYPNPLGSGSGGLLKVALENPYGVTVMGRLYGISGELVAVLSNGADKQALVLDLGQHPLSGGVYIMMVTDQAPWGTQERRSLKIAILH
jgi:flagellar hook assembly protein FlgD